MRTILKKDNAFYLIGIIFTAYYLWGVRFVPFHPDESTYLYMSSDFRHWVTNPSSLIWDQQKEGDIRQHYRKIDAPMSRYLLGFGFVLTGVDPLTSDWAWDESWEANRTSGALPSPRQLNTGRYVLALLFPLALYFLYLTGKQIQGRATGLLAVVVFSTNSLVLLHTRRAMSESPLVFASIFFLWGLTHINMRPWMLGLAAALALNSKHSLGALVLVGLLACLLIGPNNSSRNRFSAAGRYLIAFGILTLAMNPILWRQPFQIAQKALESRRELVAAQVEDFGSQNPALVLDSPGNRLMAATAQLYLIPPSFEEAGNYILQTEDDTEVYLSIPGHNLFRTLVFGALFLTVTLVGLVMGLQNIRRNGWPASQQLVLLLTATSIQTIALLLVIPLPFQRYYMPLVPYSIIWFSYGLGSLLMLIAGRLPASSPT